MFIQINTNAPANTFQKKFCDHFNKWSKDFEDYGDVGSKLFWNYTCMMKFMQDNRRRLNRTDLEHMAVLQYRYEEAIFDKLEGR